MTRLWILISLQSVLVAAYTPALRPRQCSSSTARVGITAHPRRHHTSSGFSRWRNKDKAVSHSPCSSIFLTNSNDSEDPPSSSNIGIAIAGLVAQPVVWISLYSVATTGAGLPAGPLGLLGALEGLSYLVMLGLVGASAYTKVTTGSGLPPGQGGLLGAAEGLSFVTLIAGLLTLASLIGNQGCVPNAKPILDYSAYLPVCDVDQTPGLFGQ